MDQHQIQQDTHRAIMEHTLLVFAAVPSVLLHQQNQQTQALEAAGAKTVIFEPYKYLSFPRCR